MFFNIFFLFAFIIHNLEFNTYICLVLNEKHLRWKDISERRANEKWKAEVLGALIPYQLVSKNLKSKYFWHLRSFKYYIFD